MIRFLEELSKVVPPPRTRPPTAKAADDSAWFDIETELGTRLPTDYKSLIGLYGGGKFKEFLWLLSPFSADESLSLVKRARRRTEKDREFRDAIPEEFQFNIYPERHGLLLCAVTDTGSPIYWVTKGPVDRWPLLIQASRDPRLTLSFDGTLTSLLLKVLSGKIHVRFFPSGYEESPSTFAPAIR